MQEQPKLRAKIKRFFALAGALERTLLVHISKTVSLNSWRSHHRAHTINSIMPLNVLITVQALSKLVERYCKPEARRSSQGAIDSGI